MNLVLTEEPFVSDYYESSVTNTCRLMLFHNLQQSHFTYQATVLGSVL
jgi:hypothetical protein